jgi:hypothetical protein
MIKLYKKQKDTILYWEAWENEGDVIVHTGTIGDRGQTRTVRAPGKKNADTIIREEAKTPRQDGFRELRDDELFSFVIQYRLATWGSGEDLTNRNSVEDVLNECLGWTGNGHCDGGDIGSGSMNIFCFVVDPQVALRSTLEWLREKELDKDVIIAYMKEDDFVVLWPTSFSGAFSVL